MTKGEQPECIWDLIRDILTMPTSENEYWDMTDKEFEVMCAEDKQ